MGTSSSPSRGVSRSAGRSKRRWPTDSHGPPRPLHFGPGARPAACKRSFCHLGWPARIGQPQLTS
eukprot:4737884-Pyramimonas_sp.AAC.1